MLMDSTTKNEFVKNTTFKISDLNKIYSYYSQRLENNSVVKSQD